MSEEREASERRRASPAFVGAADVLEIFRRHPAAFRYVESSAVRSGIAKAVAATLEGRRDLVSVDRLLSIHDYRILADRMRLVATGGEELARSIGSGSALRERRLLDTRRCSLLSRENPSDGAVLEVLTPEELLEPFSGTTARTYYGEAAGEVAVAGLMDVCAGDISNLFDGVLDLDGPFRLVRKGLVKSTFLPDGREVVLKQRNPMKGKRFVNELRAITQLGERFGHSRIVDVADSERSLRVRLLQYLAFVGSGDGRLLFSVSAREPLPTLEEFLMLTSTERVRLDVLADVRLILNWLYSNGIVWGDMAPRNILIDISKATREYVLLDFEKTAFTDGPVTPDEREQHARGEMCTEEFGAICSLDEVVYCFGEYFHPDRWDTGASQPIRLRKVKGDYIDLLAQRGIAEPTQAQYDAFERKVMDVRFPYRDSESGRFVYPIHNGFRIDHYFGGNFERDLLSTLLVLKPMGLSRQCTALVGLLLDTVDAELFLDEFTAIAEGRVSKRMARDSDAGRRLPSVLSSLATEKSRPGLQRALAFAEQEAVHAGDALKDRYSS